MKYAVVTGGGSGLGRAIALQLVKNNPELVVLAVGRTAASLDETLRLASAELAARLQTVVTDIATAEGRAAVTAALPVDAEVVYLVHNASVATAASFQDITEASWDYQLSVGLTAPMFLTQTLLPYMRPGARVLTISSGFAHVPSDCLLAYSVAKSGLVAFWKGFNADPSLKPLSISCGSVQPGMVDTAMQEKMRGLTSAHPEFANKFVIAQRDGKLRAPEDVAEFVVNVLMYTSDDEFKTVEWNVNDTEHHVGAGSTPGCRA